MWESFENVGYRYLKISDKISSYELHIPCVTCPIPCSVSQIHVAYSLRNFSAVFIKKQSTIALRAIVA